MSWRAVCECGWRGIPGSRESADKEAWRHGISHWLEESCKASGVPLKVQDPRVLRDIAVLFGFKTKDRSR